MDSVLQRVSEMTYNHAILLRKNIDKVIDKDPEGVSIEGYVSILNQIKVFSITPLYLNGVYYKLWSENEPLVYHLLWNTLIKQTSESDLGVSPHYHYHGIESLQLAGGFELFRREGVFREGYQVVTQILITSIVDAAEHSPAKFDLEEGAFEVIRSHVRHSDTSLYNLMGSLVRA